MIVDDHQIMLDGLNAIFKRIDDIEVVNAVNSISEAKANISSEIDILLLDVNLGDENSITLVNWMRCHFKEVKIIGFSLHNESHIISSFMHEGCKGFVNKQAGDDELVRAIRSVYNGNIFIGSNTIESVSDLFDAENKKSVLTKREIEVLLKLVQDLNSRQIAEQLYISPSTVESHKKNIMEKLQIKTISGLIRYAIKNDLIFV